MTKSDPRCGEKIATAGGVLLFTESVAGRSYCATVSRAERIAFFMLLLGVSQEVAKKETWTFPPRPPCLPPFYDKRRGFCFCKIPPSWAHISHAQDGFTGGKICRYPVGVDASATRLCGGLRLSREADSLPYGWEH